MAKSKIFITRQIPKAGIDFLKKKRYQVRVYPKDRIISKRELYAGAKWADALLCLLTDKIDSTFIKKNKHLKIIANFAVGFDNIDLKSATEHGIAVTNTPEVLTEAVAEHSIALLFSLARRVHEGDMFMHKGKYKGWEPMLFLGTQLREKTIGIIGLGRIGKEVAHRCVGLGMKVLYTKRNRDKGFEKRYHAQFVSQPQLLRKSDFVSLHVPLTKGTYHLIDKKELKMMKKTAYIINTSRGPVINEKELVRAIKNKEIAGAALDVFEYEPKVAPGLDKLDNVVLTPHMASATIEARSAMSEMAAKNIDDVLSGKRPLQIVNPDVYKKK